MPNHVTTVCTVTGDAEQVSAFRVAHVHLGEDGPCFDFETIIPMPQCVKNTIQDFSIDEPVCDEDVSQYARALLENRQLPIVNKQNWVPAAVMTWGHLIEWYDRTNPTVAMHARAALLCAAETGRGGWYDWSCGNWGTKWNAYWYRERTHEPGRFVFSFDTAWSVPGPILEKLADLWPGLLIEIESIDEGGPQFVGRFHGTEKRLDSVPEDAARNERVYGGEPGQDHEGDTTCEAVRE